VRINIIDCFEDTVKKYPDKIAVEHNDDKITFLELQNKAIYLSNLISETIGGKINRPIAVFLPKQINTVIADLGITYSGNPFMNLDVKTPIERIGNIIDLVEPELLITSTKYANTVNCLKVKVLIVDEIDFSKTMNKHNKWKNNIIDTDPFCLINTSGSTGTPKGVVLNHRSFFDFIDWANERFNFNGNEIMGSLSPVVFDIFDFELCMMMINSSRIVILDAGLAAFPARLLEVVRNKMVNFIFWVPSIMVNIANLDLISKLPLDNLETIWFAGEVFPTKQFNYWYQKIPNACFVNLYGPIEITLDCTYYIISELPDEDTPLPIGIPCRNTDVLILDENDNLCDIDCEGELCVRGTSLAMGYYNNPEKTAIAFTQNPLNKSYPELIYRTGDIVSVGSDGLIYFKGRKDSLIKHMGYRIELAEIEHIIVNQLQIVNYCCAVYNYNTKQIVLFYENENDIDAKEFRKQLVKVVPSYMVPNVFERMDILPRNTNGKIDRLLLKNKVN